MGRKKMSMIDFIRKNPNMSAQEIYVKRGGNLGTIRTLLHKVRKEMGLPPGKRGRPAGSKAIARKVTDTDTRNLRITMAIRHLKKALEYLHVNTGV